MARLTIIGRTSALVFLLSSTASFADVTASEAWEGWKGLFESYGQSVATSSEEMSGDTLTVNDIVLSMDTPDASGSGSIDQMVFQEQGDGTVRITMSPDYRITSSSAPDGGPEVEMNMVMSQTGLVMIASGTADDIAYDIDADSVVMTMGGMTFDGEQAPFDLTMTANDVAGEYSVANSGDALQVDSVVNAASGEMVVTATNPDNEGTFEMNVTFDDIETTSTSSLPEGVTVADLDQFMKSAAVMEGQLSHGASTFSFNFNEPGQQAQGSGSADSGTFDFAMKDDTLSYETRSSGLDYSMTSSAIPLPEIALTMGEAAFGMTMPMVATDEPRDFGLLVALRDLTISDGIWALFDPMQNLPRDPATVAIDLSGSARWLIDILNPEAAADPSANPGELESLSLDELEVSLAGARLTGTGDFTFDNTDTTTFDGMPKPTGSADLMLTGGNGLMDKLVEMGLLPEEQAMGARMMMGLFARPGEGEDELVSTIEVTEDGQVLANGQRIR